METSDREGLYKFLSDGRQLREVEEADEEEVEKMELGQVAEAVWLSAAAVQSSWRSNPEKMWHCPS